MNKKQYHSERFLGEGSFGHVSLVFDQSGKYFALKKVHYIFVDILLIYFLVMLVFHDYVD